MARSSSRGRSSRTTRGSDPFNGNRFVLDDAMSPDARKQVRFASEERVSRTIPTQEISSAPLRRNASRTALTTAPTAFLPDHIPAKLRLFVYALFLLGSMSLVYLAPTVVRLPLGRVSSAFSASRSLLPFRRLSRIAGLPNIFAANEHGASQHLNEVIDALVKQALRAHIGPRDYALAIDGALIISGLTTSAPHPHNSVRSNFPEIILRENLEGGRCWSLGDRRGQVGIALPSVILPSHFTIDHVPSEVAEDIGEAPRKIRLWGALDGRLNEQRYREYTLHSSVDVTSTQVGLSLTQGYTFVLLANATYDIHSPSFIQRFPLSESVIASRMTFGVFVLEIVDNWGADSACIYRVRIHGTSLVD